MTVRDIDSDDPIMLDLQNHFLLSILHDIVLLDTSDDGSVLFSKDEVIKLIASLQKVLERME
jgi:hypothetical protein